MISTPSQFNVLLNAQRVSNPSKISPKFVVLDEFDQLIVDKKYQREIKPLLYRLGSHKVDFSGKADEEGRKVTFS